MIVQEIEQQIFNKLNELQINFDKVIFPWCFVDLTVKWTNVPIEADVLLSGDITHKIRFVITINPNYTVGGNGSLFNVDWNTFTVEQIQEG